MELLGASETALITQSSFLCVVRCWSCVPVIHQLGTKLSLRQRVIATAQLLFLRFYSRSYSSPTAASFCSHDPRLVAPTCIFIASKAEECGVNGRTVVMHMNRLRAHTTTTTSTTTPVTREHSVTLKLAGEVLVTLAAPPASLVNDSAPIVSTLAAAAAAAATSSTTGAAITLASSSLLLPTALAAKLVATSTMLPVQAYPYSVSQLLEMEFAVLSGVQYDLVVWHPYQRLEQSDIITQIGCTRLNGGARCAVAHVTQVCVCVCVLFASLLRLLVGMGHSELLQQGIEILNDCYRTDLPLLHPPYLLASAALVITCSFHQVECDKFKLSLGTHTAQVPTST